MQRLEKGQKEFAVFLKEYFNENNPQNWDNNRYGVFPYDVSYTSFRNYFFDIITINQNQTKINAINDFYDLNADFDNEKILDKIDGKPRTIQFFFKDTNRIPKKNLLNFMAVAFDAPIKSLEEFNKKYLTDKQTTNNALQKDIEQTKLQKNIQTNPIAQKIKKHPKIFVTTTSIVLIALVVIYFKFLTTTQATESKLIPDKYQEAQILASTISIQYAENNGFIKKIPQEFSLEYANNDTITFKTTEICNDKAIFKKGQWDFSIDSTGEDMSAHGDYKEQIQSMFPTLNCTPIANREMYIRFEISNKNENPCRLKSFMIKQEAIYDAVAEKVKYNLYQARSENEYHTICLNSDTTLYQQQVTNQRLNANETYEILLKITCNKSLKNKIVRFKIICALTYENQKIQLNSDKEYLIGCLID